MYTYNKIKVCQFCMYKAAKSNEKYWSGVQYRVKLLFNCRDKQNGWVVNSCEML